ncbi:hypothetical protein BCR41DRAFT_34811 [Lobosporangium transversale]|uniref:Uncharacterized protein n=1 Tax=Lobosporangium transversale TaxID=64571 RepID=A0A1Y2GRB4_9FUNG|nr:hypothetical protein BCR41DRAFT_34811 [Lobosporangium transversale]ORZ20063.1 hypothetical protein BCR41DRAFT_34811 [Lobosporangium transversale]|eukprot:XP_021882603.1 hypothetical protein BCR41DRAFT_34811 [Lobosporangium transversale]
MFASFFTPLLIINAMVSNFDLLAKKKTFKAMLNQRHFNVCVFDFFSSLLPSLLLSPSHPFIFFFLFSFQTGKKAFHVLFLDVPDASFSFLYIFPAKRYFVVVN